MRTLGFAAAPGLLQVFGVFREITTFVFLLSAAWMLAAMVVALRQALDYTNTTRALLVCSVGWLSALLMAVILGVVFSRVVY